MRIGVVLMNLGGPTREENVQDFLYNLFSDEDIIKMGGGKMQNLFAGIISKFRAPHVAEDYKRINGCPKGCTGNRHCVNRRDRVVSDCCSPINGLTERQRRALERQLKGRLSDADLSDVDVKVYTCMRYWLPFADTIMDDMVADGITHTVLLPLYPQFSWTTTGSSFRDWANVAKAKYPDGKRPWKEFHVKNYYLNEDYLSAMHDRIDEALGTLDEEARDKAHFIFTAHGTPLLEVNSGDPYTAEIKETMEAIMARREKKNPYWLSYQSKVGPQKWTQPNTEDLVRRHLQYGIRNFVMIPVAFVTDHIETLYELEVELLEDLEGEGYKFETLTVMKGINEHPAFIKSLADEAMNCLQHEIPGFQINQESARTKTTEIL